MCGRYSLMATAADLAQLLQTPVVGESIPLPAVELRPTDRIPVVLESLNDPGRRLDAARWDLARPRQPELARRGSPLINVRSESVTEKFPWAVKQRRCLIPAGGYWEWNGPRGGRQRYFLRHPDHPIVAMAGVYSWWRDPTRGDDDPARWALTAAIMTTAADQRMGEVHDRTPVMVPDDVWSTWLDPEVMGDGELVDHVVDAHAGLISGFEFYPVAATGSPEALTTPLP